MQQKPRMELIRHSEEIVSNMNYLETTLSRLLGKQVSRIWIRENQNKVVLKADVYFKYTIGKNGEDVTEELHFANVRPS